MTASGSWWIITVVIGFVPKDRGCGTPSKGPTFMATYMGGPHPKPTYPSVRGWSSKDRGRDVHKNSPSLSKHSVNASHAGWIIRGHHVTPTQTIRKKKANQQKVHHAFALFEFDPNCLKTDLVIHDLNILVFQVFFQNGWHNPGGHVPLKKIALHTCINVQNAKNSKPRHNSSQQTSTNINKQ